MSLLDLAGPFGAVGEVRRVSTEGWMPREVTMFAAYTGNPSAVSGPYRTDARTGYGTGRAYGDPDRARLLAVAEALERYAGLVVDPRRLTLAPACSLGSSALDLRLIPRCSARELARPGCPVSDVSDTQAIRWVEASCLHTGSRVLVPAVMAFLEFPSLEAENFWIPISTGCAVHTSFEAAVVGALCEVIERDALALTWLQRLPLPPLAEGWVSDSAQAIIGWCAARGISTWLFDATTDMGVPVVYCLQTTERSPRGAQLVGAACGFDVGSLAEHALLETMGLRAGIQARRVPRRYADFQTIEDGAAAMSLRTRRPAFSFLLNPHPTPPPHPTPHPTSLPGPILALPPTAGLALAPASVSTRAAAHAPGLANPLVTAQPHAGASASPLSPAQPHAGGAIGGPHSLGGGTDGGRLEFLLGRLAELGMSAYVVDLTTRELRDSGHVAVRVLIPALQPMSARPLVQYRGHPRLYTAPPRMGHRALPERRLNPYPQPMA